MELTLAAKAENIPVARQAVRALVARHADPEFAGDVSTALTEAAMNAVVHAYPDGEGEFQVKAAFDGRRLQIEVRDWGTGIQPRPADSSEGLRIGLPLIATLSDEFEVRSGLGGGTWVKMMFDLDRDGEPETPAASPPPRSAGETVIKVSSDDGIAPSVASALAMLAARADLSVDRVADVQVLGDLLATAISRNLDDPVCLRISEAGNGIEIRVGPFPPGAAERVIEKVALPNLGNAFDSLADSWQVESGDEEDSLLIVVGES
jgi:anti-sigma regulatory factor (Ser/Thr protein kinase)